MPILISEKDHPGPQGGEIRQVQKAREKAVWAQRRAAL